MNTPTFETLTFADAIKAIEDHKKAMERINRIRELNKINSAKSYLRKKLREAGVQTIEEYDALKKVNSKPRKYGFISV